LCWIVALTEMEIIVWGEEISQGASIAMLEPHPQASSAGFLRSFTWPATPVSFFHQ